MSIRECRTMKSQLSWCESIALEDDQYLQYTFAMHKTDHRGIKSCGEQFVKSSWSRLRFEYLFDLSNRKLVVLEQNVWIGWDKQWSMFCLWNCQHLTSKHPRRRNWTGKKRMIVNKCFNIKLKNENLMLGMCNAVKIIEEQDKKVMQ